ncbi:biotin-dependent carboxyltransferase family protein [Paenibacillus oenotherae]|uniref:Biotin-dependent carboxyltransferase family protein n=1 Tax=Paenibacillus oenotherae TaxID=1435645 RepID=A0ABS7D3F9_9BACL|nr:biotin-dependent carboxyltransferase family protein [Paenibacillus oenotherae]MBW7474438.1 biotin-dependent carboxyltransferase family protein [Paenibacillus oenotherae]
MSLTVMKPGFYTTIQDLGRPGWRRDGIPLGGAMDRYALRTANLLVGNEEGAAGLELTLVGPTLTVERDMLLAICGAHMSPHMDGEELPMWRPLWAAAGSRITFGAALAGCRAYIAVAGGIHAAAVLGSRSTDVRAGIGGVDGRPLQAGDTLPCGERDSAGGARAAWQRLWRAELAARAGAQPRGRNGFAAPGWFAPPLAYGGGAADGIELRAMPGSEFGRLSAAARRAFFTERYNVAPASDRMGVRLAGPPLELSDSTELLSHGVVPGTVQLPSGGMPIVLAADCQTTGGYPKIAHVITADLPLLAQARPGAAITFRSVTLAEAQRIEIAFERDMRQLAAGICCRMP